MVGIPLAFTAPAWAAIVSCPAFPTTAAISTLPSGSGNGCSNGNLQFTNFLIGTTTNTINGTTLVANVTTFTAPSAASINTGASNGGDIHFSTGAVPPCTNGAFCVSGKNQSLSATINYQLSTIDLTAMIAAIQLSGTLSVNAQGASTLFLEVCPNTTVFSQGCGGYQVAQLLATGSVSLPFAAGVNTVAIRETVYLTTGNGNGSSAAVSAFDAITLAPEPATLTMVGLALTGLVGLRFRNRKPRRPA